MFYLIISSFLSFLSLKKFNNKVTTHTNTEENNGEDELGEHTDTTSLGDESKKEAHGFPESVVGEGSFFIRCKENSIEGVDLSLPDGITNTPKSSKHIHN